ncbi:MAG: DsbA family protein [Proteobacteria bacterium]|nr:DsbA family protein [Pseudomonadota bacterium]
MGPLCVPVYYDFASSLCYVAHRVLERMAPTLAELQLALQWTPLDLTRITGWRRGAHVEGPRRANALRVARELQVSVRMPTAWLDSRASGALALRLEGDPRAVTWRERVFSAAFEEGRDIGDPEEHARLLRELELEPGDAESGARALDEATRSAVEAGVTGVPTFLLGEWPFGGIQTDDTMRHVLTRYARKARGEL